MPAIREAVGQLDARLALADVRTMAQIWADSLSGLREPAWLVGVVALVAALVPARRATRVEPAATLRSEG